MKKNKKRIVAATNIVGFPHIQSLISPRWAVILELKIVAKLDGEVLTSGKRCLLGIEGFVTADDARSFVDFQISLPQHWEDICGDGTIVKCDLYSATVVKNDVLTTAELPSRVTHLQEVA